MSPVPYFNPPEAVIGGEVGRKLADTAVVPRPYSHYADQLRKGELLYVALRGGLVPPQLVAYAYDEATYYEFYNRYLSGMYTQIGLYALSPSEAEEQ